MTLQTYQIHFRDGCKSGGGSLRKWRGFVLEQRQRGVLTDDVTEIALGMTVHMSKDDELVPFSIAYLALACGVSASKARSALETLQRKGLLRPVVNNVLQIRPPIWRASILGHGGQDGSAA